MKAGIHIEGGKATKLNQRLLTVLNDRLREAIYAGREQTAMHIVQALRDLGGVTGTTISNCTINGGLR